MKRSDGELLLFPLGHLLDVQLVPTLGIPIGIGRAPGYVDRTGEVGRYGSGMYLGHGGQVGYLRQRLADIERIVADILQLGRQRDAAEGVAVEEDPTANALQGGGKDYLAQFGTAAEGILGQADNALGNGNPV